MFKPPNRTTRNTPRPTAGFAETQFVHHADDDDYSGFAPTQLFGDDGELTPVPAARAADAHAAASRSRTVLERAAKAPQAAAPAVGAATAAPAWATSQWAAAQETKAHEAADQARALIAAQRHAEEQADAAANAVPRTGLGRLRAAFEKLLPGEFRSLLPLFVGVTASITLISAVLPMIDKV